MRKETIKEILKPGLNSMRTQFDKDWVLDFIANKYDAEMAAWAKEYLRGRNKC